MLEHVDVSHVPLLQILLGLLDLVFVVLLHLLVLQLARKHFFRTFVLLNNKSLPIGIVLHGCLCLSKSKLHVILSQLDLKLLLFSSLEKPVLDCELFLLFKDLGLLKKEGFLGCL